MNSQPDNSDDRRDKSLWRRFAAANASSVPAGPCIDEITMASYLEGRVEAEEIEALELHLADCSDCRTALAELRELLAQPSIVMPRAGFGERAAAAAAPARRGDGLWRRVVRWGAMAAAVLLVAWAGFAAGRKTVHDYRQADTALVQQVTFGLDSPDGETVVASVDAFDEMLFVGGDEQ
jgi:predicted anti-sigma-YlaC factor YlaD